MSDFIMKYIQDKLVEEGEPIIISEENDYVLVNTHFLECSKEKLQIKQTIRERKELETFLDKLCIDGHKITPKFQDANYLTIT